MNSMNNFNIFVESFGYCWIECPNGQKSDKSVQIQQVGMDL